MAYAELKEALYQQIEGLAARPAFKRIIGADTIPANVSANSGALRKFELIGGSQTRGSAVVGTGPKQVNQTAQLIIYYPQIGNASDLDTRIQADKVLVRDALESIEWYDFPSTGLQNVKWLGDNSLAREGLTALVCSLSLTYIGSVA